MFDATPPLRLYAGWRSRQLDREDPIKAQVRELLKLVTKARDTRFGRDHGFDGIGDVGTYQERVPLRRFEDIWEDYWSSDFPVLTDCTWPGTVPFFAETSGTTTGKTKYIPCTHEMNRSNTFAGADILVHHLRNTPGSRLLAGLNFVLGGSTGLRELAPGVRSGDLSGIAASVMPRWARWRYFPPRDLEAITDWEERLDALAHAAIGQDIRSISGTPSWLLIFFDRLAALQPNADARLSSFFPNLEMIVHGAVHFAPYRASFDEWLAGSQAQTREVYAASEGFIGIADRGDGEGMRLIADGGLFYEFVPVDELGAANPTRHWLATIETGVDYAIILTTCAGAWSYVLGDTVAFVDRTPPRLVVTGRTSFTLSAFGEHLIASEIDDAVTHAADTIDARVVEFAVGPVYPTAAEARGGHVYIVEFDHPEPEPNERARFMQLVDDNLAARNDDYRSHRAGMLPMELHTVEPGTFYAWMKKRGQLGGQHKVPRVINDSDLLRDLLDFADEKEPPEP